MKTPAAIDCPPPLVVLLGEPELAERASSALSDSEKLPRWFATVEHLSASGHGAPAAIVMCASEPTREQAQKLRSLRCEFPDSPVIVLAESVERWELRAILAAGAAGVLLADEQLAERLPLCINAARSGQVCVPASLQRDIAPAALSAREKQVLALVVMGYMNCQIAERLFLAESTVKSHLSSAFGKLGVRSRNEATRLILDPDRGLGMGILSLTPEPSVSNAGAQRRVERGPGAESRPGGSGPARLAPAASL